MNKNNEIFKNLALFSMKRNNINNGDVLLKIELLVQAYLYWMRASANNVLNIVTFHKKESKIML